MKKLLFSTFSIVAIASAVLVGCKDGGGGTTDPPKTGPKISFQTNTGTQSGYTFADDKKQVSTGSNPVIVKIGVIVTSDENLKSTKMTVKFNNQAETLVGTDSIFSSNTKTCNRDYFWRVPEDKGKYTLTAYATDKNATTSTATIVITAFGPLTEREDTAVIYSLKAVGAGKFSAFDLLTNEAITAASGAGNESRRDIVDASVTSSLSRSWKSQNGTEFKMSTGSTLNGKVYSQFQSQQDLIDAWNAASSGAASTTITGIDDNRLIIAKSTNGGDTRYYLIAVWMINDETGSEDDYYWFQYKE
jgi:hypothetical protein